MAGNDDSDWGRNLGRGMEIAVGVGLGYFAGTWLDHKFNIAPWGLFGCVILGCAAGMYSLVKEAVRENKK